MNEEVREKVLGLLRGYPRMLREIALLRYQLDHMSVVSGDEMIESMNFSHGDSLSGVSNSGVSNKTQNIALNYQAAMARESEELRNGLRLNLHELEEERDELLRRIDLLGDDQTMVLRTYYIERKTWDETARILNFSKRTALRIRDAAISELCRIYMAL
ncbi:MAG: hypothetical protein IJT94_17040 [Oscillibacter sp.]|nr:hypothetical protein [Oscillibacter sp.]